MQPGDFLKLVYVVIVWLAVAIAGFLLHQALLAAGCVSASTSVLF